MNIDESGEQTTQNISLIRANKRYVLCGILCVGVVLFLGFAWYVATPPASWKEPETVTITRGTSAGIIANNLKEKSLIRSSFVFRSLARITGRSQSLRSGTFVLEPSSMVEILYRLSKGSGEARITIPEGSRAREIAQIFTREGIFVTEQNLVAHEGYLFPDTYQVAKDATADDVVRMLRTQFEEKFLSQLKLGNTLSRSKEDIVTMASILEKESAGDADRAIIAGILWKRLDNSMRLQVDATLAYERGETSATLSTADLAIDSPYNTYRRDGLPPTPTGNPGAKALGAAMWPEESPYWYYLHDKAGNTYYARTLNEHVANKRKYLK